MTTAQREILRRLRAGESLWWFGDAGPEISGRPGWPLKATVRALLAAGVLR